MLFPPGIIGYQEIKTARKRVRAHIWRWVTPCAETGYTGSIWCHSVTLESNFTELRHELISERGDEGLRPIYSSIRHFVTRLLTGEGATYEFGSFCGGVSWRTIVLILTGTYSIIIAGGASTRHDAYCMCHWWGSRSGQVFEPQDSKETFSRFHTDRPFAQGLYATL